jgi:hypothetical protein
MCSYYIGPNFIGNEFDRPSRRAVFSPAPASRAATPIVRSESSDNVIASIHEATHTCFNYYTGRGVFSVELDGDGGGRFRAHAGDTRAPTLTGAEAPIKVAVDSDSKLEWCSLLVGQIAPLIAQRRYGGRASDGICWHDILTVDRILSCISSSPAEQHDMRAEIERKARRFVTLHWPAILRLAHALYRGGRLDKYEVIDVLSRASSAKLNEVGVKNCADLIAAGCVSYSPFAWDSDEDAEELFLGVVSDDDTTGPKLVYPYGANGQVYVEALKAAQKEGGTIGQYASKLLADIEVMQKQSLKNTPRPRAYARDPDMLWRYDGGFLRPLR